MPEETKSGARHSAGDTKLIQDIHDRAIELGATPASEKRLKTSVAHLNKQYVTGRVKEINLESRTLTAYASTGDMDRDGEVIAPEAWRKTIEQYKSVPLIWAHDYRIPPIGKASDFAIDGKGLKFKAEFADSVFGREIWGLYKDGFLNAFSVGFIPKQATEGQTPHEPGKTFTEAELLEVSSVPIPSNPFATVERGVLTLAFKAVDSFTYAPDAGIQFSKERGPEEGDEDVTEEAEEAEAPTTEEDTDDLPATTDDDTESTAEQEALLLLTLTELSQYLQLELTEV